jgi:hypothetical protein
MTADAPPAIHAPDRSRDDAGAGASKASGPERSPGWIYARAPIALGGGSSGIAALVGLELDVWPIRWLGIGAEYVRGGSTGVRPGETPDHDDFQARRFRLSGRLPFRAGGLFVLTLAGGVGRYSASTYNCINECQTNPGEGYDSTKTVKIGRPLTGAIEAAIYQRKDAFHAGVVARVDVVGHAGAFTVGPALGVEF